MRPADEARAPGRAHEPRPLTMRSRRILLWMWLASRPWEARLFAPSPLGEGRGEGHLVGAVGLEPTSVGLRVRHSPVELRASGDHRNRTETSAFTARRAAVTPRSPGQGRLDSHQDLPLQRRTFSLLNYAPTSLAPSLRYDRSSPVLRTGAVTRPARKAWRDVPGSNRRPADRQSDALPLS